MAIQVRRGNEVDFDATKMLPGEWAVSLDTKYVRMCFAPGVCLRMATYEGFEENMAQIEAILKECQDIEEAVAKIKTEINAVAIEVEEFATSAEENALKSQSYAVGGTGTRENESIDNAKYFYNQLKQFSQGITGLIPMGTITFAELPQLSVGDSAFMYNISDDFVSDERFNDGGGVSYGAGNNVFWTAEGKWDVTASSAVNGIKGSAEEDYRTGNVTIKPEDLGLENVLPLLGDTDISQIGNGTVTGGLSKIIKKFANYLPLTGGKLTGGLFTNHVVPNENDTYYLGQSNLTYHRIYGNTFYVQKNNVTYGTMQVVAEGTESVTGTSQLMVGNKTARGTKGNARGVILLCGVDTGHTQITPSNNTSNNIEILLPSTAGTLALQSEVQALETRIAQLEAALLTLSQE